MSNLERFGRPTAFPSMAELDRPGVYFLWQGDVIVYVGQARSMRKRIGQHISEGRKAFDGISHQVYDESELLTIESQLIRVLAPKYNACSVARIAKQQDAMGEASASVSVHHFPSSGFVTDEQAASFLQISMAELGGLKQSGRLKYPRHARSRTRSKFFTIEGLSKFKAAMLLGEPQSAA